VEKLESKGAAVVRLTDQVLETIRQDASGEVLRGMIRYGFQGFEHMSVGRLAAELRLRGLSQPFDLAASNDDDPDDVEDAELESDLGDFKARSSGRSSAVDDDRK
jgi:hypothetical protein